MQDQVLAILRGQLTEIIAGTLFVFIGLTVCAMAAIRRRRGVRLFLWLGIWSAMYETPLLTACFIERDYSALCQQGGKRLF